jgi:hypothetical protein
MARGEAMIDSPPEFQLTCNCGIRISGTNENGVISLLKRHIESGVFHTGYLLANKFELGGTELERILSEISTLRKGIRNASTRGNNNND